MSRPWSRWPRHLVTCALVTACGRLGYLPEEATGGSLGRQAASRVDGAVVGDDAATEAASSADAATMEDATLAGDDAAPETAGDAAVAITTDATVAADRAAPEGGGAPDATAELDAADANRGGGLPDADIPGADAGVVYPTCDAPCCCAYICTYAVAPSASVCAGSTDSAQYSFESGTQGWVESDSANSVIAGQVSVSTAETFAGSASLAATVNIPAGSQAYVRFDLPPIPAGATVTFHVWVPPGATLPAVQAYVMDKNYTWTGMFVWSYDLVFGCWSTIEVSVPTTAATPLFEVGVEFFAPTAASYAGVVYVDSVSW